MKSIKALGFVIVATAITSFCVLTYAQTPAPNNGQRNDSPTRTCPMMDANKPGEADSDTRHAGVMKRGEKAMGFSQSTTTHHFLLLPDGGVIQVEVNNQPDSLTRDQVRGHLKHIAQMFSEGNFEIPMLIHDQVPPGVPTMQALKAEIKYTFAETEKGALVRISTSNQKALAAIHDFLRFQVFDHKTGDPIPKNK